MFEIFKDKKFVLASSSIRRSKLLSEMGIEFELIKFDFDEEYPADLALDEIALYISKRKFDFAIKSILDTNTILITADTTVICRDKLLGKPKEIDEAREMLYGLSGTTHEVITGVSIGNKDSRIDFSETTIVHVNHLTDLEINYYIENFSVLDKAGGYGIQDWFGIAGISKIYGSYTNVIGLPTQKLFEKLKEILN